MTTRLALLSGGVGGALLARGLSTLPDVALSVVVNVGDDDRIHGLAVSPDPDTVLYTLAGIEGPEGWGVARDTFHVLDRLGELGADTGFRLGDLDLATHIYRTSALADGLPLSVITDRLRQALGVGARVLPMTDDPVATRVQTGDGLWRSFQDYFVTRGHTDEVIDLVFEGAERARPAPGVLESIGDADAVIIGPSNPPLSIWPILAVPGIAERVGQAERVMAISPLFGGKALKGSADRVLASLGFPKGNQGVLEAYGGMVTDFVVDTGDASEASMLTEPEVRVHVADTRISKPEESSRFAVWLQGIL